MIPPQIAARAPQGEQLLFRKLRDDPKTKEWLVFHSFDIRRHVTRTEGEADLVVAVPGVGILCIEVKGCGVSRQSGLWIYEYDPPRKSPVGPFRQASDAAHSLRQFISGRDTSFLPVIFYSAVFFTEIDFKETSMEWELWQVVGKTELLRNPVSALVTRILESAHSKLRGMHPPPGWYGERSRPESKQMESLVRLLRHDFEYAVVGGLALELAEQSIRKFTEEQFNAIDLMNENPRILFKGPAGTGKTLLAVEAARRAVRARQGVALVCFNNFLGGWLRRETAGVAQEARDLGVRFFAGTAASFMLDIAHVAVPPDPGSAFWSVELPGIVVDTLLSGRTNTVAYDTLLLDEAQDLLTDAVLDVFELATVGGLASGHWAMFGDFERQAIYAGAGAQPGLARLKERAGASFTVFPLRINCRNARPIVDVVTLASGLVPGYSRVLADTDAPDVEPVFYRSPQHQIDQLYAIVKRLTRKFRANQIVVLSMRADFASCASAASGQPDGIRFAPFKLEAADESTILFASIHAFKGLESAAIVLTDVEGIEDDQAKALVYVGMTRARLALVLLMADRVRTRYDALLMDGYRAAQKKGLA